MRNSVLLFPVPYPSEEIDHLLKFSVLSSLPLTSPSLWVIFCVIYLHLKCRSQFSPIYFSSGLISILENISLHIQIIDICKIFLNSLVLLLYHNSSLLTLPLPVFWIFYLWCSFELLWILMLILFENTDSVYILSFIFVWKLKKNVNQF